MWYRLCNTNKTNDYLCSRQIRRIRAALYGKIHKPKKDRGNESEKLPTEVTHNCPQCGTTGIIKIELSTEQQNQSIKLQKRSRLTTQKKEPVASLATYGCDDAGTAALLANMYFTGSKTNEISRSFAQENVPPSDDAITQHPHSTSNNYKETEQSEIRLESDIGRNMSKSCLTANHAPGERQYLGLYAALSERGASLNVNPRPDCGDATAWLEIDELGLAVSLISLINILGTMSLFRMFVFDYIVLHNILCASI